MLTLNNVEVVYDGVILVLKGITLTARPGTDHHTSRREWRGEDDNAEGDLWPAPRGTRPGHQGFDRVRR